MVFLSTFNLNQYHLPPPQIALECQNTIMKIISGKLHLHGTLKKTTIQPLKFHRKTKISEILSQTKSNLSRKLILKNSL